MTQTISERLAQFTESLRFEDIPPEVLEQVGRLSTLAIVERIRALKDINRALMEYLNDVGQDPGIRQ